MNQNDHYRAILRRFRTSSREIAIALVLTLAAAIFLLTALTGDQSRNNRPIAIVEPMQQKM